MSTFGYRKELKKNEEVDEDELLATLSSEELQELERELAVLDDNVPIGLRQKDQTAKIPTGTFDRDALMKYWEDENKKLVEDERMEDERMEDERMEDERMEDRQEGRQDKSRGEGVTVTTDTPGKTSDSDRKKMLPKGKRAQNVSSENDAKEDQTEKKDECKKEAPIRIKCPLKNGLSKVSKGELKTTETTEQNPNTISDRASGNTIVIDETLKQILSNDPTVSEVNLNNIEDISQETLLRFPEALCTNTHVHVFSLANTHADDRVAFAVSKMLRENRFIRNLNIESNFVSGQGILALIAALQHNQSLVELRFHNQRHICGGKVEMEMVQLLRENTTLLKLGYQFDLPGPRMTSTSILTRNQDQQRQRRLQEKKEHSPPEESADIFEDLKNTLKPSIQKRRDEPTHLPPPQRSGRDDLMAAIRGSSIGSLKRVDLSQA
ncbi:hypothetical protein JOQ06_021701 [Pogonophryne albipinna]|uniref:Leiomodin-3 n=1 Tax=Pogonophryne albipinna TaxID=1090488 RepID=A0AAD6AD77_9TELE|nr:hypothetical protein JOQ06_021701 [Pogonophryne albipinna]